MRLKFDLQNEIKDAFASLQLMKKYFILVLSLLATSFIFAQDINQFTSFWGYKYYVDAQPISKPEVEEMLTIYPGALSDWKRAKGSETIGYLLLGAELGFAYWTISASSRNKLSAGPFIGLLGTGIGALVFSFRGRKLRRQALLSHNQLNNNTKRGLLLNSDGVGMQWKF